MRSPHLVYPCIDGHWNCFYLLAIVNRAAMNMSVPRSVQVPTLSSFGYIIRIGTAGSYVSSIFNFLRNCPTIFRSGCTVLHFHRPCTTVGFGFVCLFSFVCFGGKKKGGRNCWSPWSQNSAQSPVNQNSALVTFSCQSACPWMQAHTCGAKCFARLTYEEIHRSSCPRMVPKAPIQGRSSFWIYFRFSTVHTKSTHRKIKSIHKNTGPQAPPKRQMKPPWKHNQSSWKFTERHQAMVYEWRVYIRVGWCFLFPRPTIS